MPRFAERAEARRLELEEALAELTRVVRACDGVRAIYVFGSMGRRDVGPKSDLDVLVVRETTLRGPDRALDLAQATMKVFVPLDIIVVTPEEFRDKLPASPFGRTILRDLRRVDAT